MPLDQTVRNAINGWLADTQEWVSEDVIDFVLDFFFIPPVNDGTIPNTLIKPKTDEPVEKIIRTPIEEPQNTIKPAPDIIFPDPDAPNFDIDPVIIPTIPNRRYPQPPISNSSNTENTYTITVSTGLRNRTYGCLLVKPFYSQPLEWCDYPSTDNFWDKLEQQIRTSLQNIVDNFVDGALENACEIAFALLPIPAFIKPIVIFGCANIGSIAEYYRQRNRAIDNYPVSGLISTGGINKTSCQPYEYEPNDIPFELKGNDIEFDECGIPLGLYENVQGKKPDQLQILWRSENFGQDNYRKQTTFPFAKSVNDYDEELFKTVLPSLQEFGNVKYLVELKDKNRDIDNVANIIFFGAELDSNSQQNFFTISLNSWFQAFSDTSIAEIINWNAKIFPIDNFKLSTGLFYPYSAVILGWDNNINKWITKAKWFIYKTKPTN